MSWNDFNDAEQQQSFELMPRGTLVKVRMAIKPGGHDNPELGWTGGWATESFETGAVYLACEFVVLAGDYARRKLWTNIGLSSPKGPAWSQMGRALVRAMLNSARNVQPTDVSPAAQAARRIRELGELDGLEFVARIDIEKDARGDLKNVIKHVIEPDHKEYSALMSASATSAASATARPAALQPAVGAGEAAVPGAAPKPAWAQ